ncbi:MAG: hypothetical protein ABJG41_05105 [Cyclobacteriaceae bacterium]
MFLPVDFKGSLFTKWTICLFLVCLSGALGAQKKNYASASFWTAFDGPPIAGSGVLYNQNGIRLSFNIFAGPDQWGQSESRCEFNNPPEGEREKWADGRTLKYYRVKYRLDNQNAGKTVYFKRSPTFTINVESPEDPIAHICHNNTGTTITASALVTEMGPNSSIEFDDEGDGSWFFNKPKVVKWEMGGYTLEDYNGPAITNKNVANHGLDDFIEELEEDFASAFDFDDITQGDPHPEVSSQINQDAGKIIGNTSGSSGSSSSSAGSVSHDYDQALCHRLVQQTSRVYQNLNRITDQAYNGDVNTQQLDQSNQEMEAYNKELIKAIEADKLSPECLEKIQKISERYVDNAVNKMNKQLKNLNYDY